MTHEMIGVAITVAAVNTAFWVSFARYTWDRGDALTYGHYLLGVPPLMLLLVLVITPLIAAREAIVAFRAENARRKRKQK